MARPHQLKFDPTERPCAHGTAMIGSTITFIALTVPAIMASLELATYNTASVNEWAYGSWIGLGLSTLWFAASVYVGIYNTKAEREHQGVEDPILPFPELKFKIWYTFWVMISWAAIATVFEYFRKYHDSAWNADQGTQFERWRDLMWGMILVSLFSVYQYWEAVWGSVADMLTKSMCKNCYDLM